MKRERVRFTDLFQIKHGYAFKGEYFDSAGPYALLTPGNFNEEGGFREIPEKQRYYTGEVPEGFLLEEGDLLVAMTEQGEGLLGSSAWIPASNRYLHNQRLGRIIELDEARLDKRYLYYLFNTREVRHQIRGSASGTKVRHTAPERIGRVEVELPTVASQRRIASILSAYDDLIENNRRRMTLLEEAARLLYREWFVRLRFPGHEHIRIIDGVPDGWQHKTLGDVCEEIRETVSPEDVEPSTPYIGLEHIPRRSISLIEWGKAESVTSDKHRYVSGDILFGKIRPYFHMAGITFTDGVASSDAVVIRPKDDAFRGIVLMTVASDKFVAEASQTMREGSKMPRADWNLMTQYPVSLPPLGLMESFSGMVTAITDQLQTACFQNKKLQQARDLLRPRLMNGEIRV